MGFALLRLCVFNIKEMKKQIVLLAALLGGTLAGHAQKKGFDYKFYGQVRTDLFYNSRSNSETVDGLFYMYPLDEVKDPNGNDLNKNGNSDFYTLYTRLGVDVTGPMLGKAKTSAKVEVDFRGSGTSTRGPCLPVLRFVGCAARCIAGYPRLDRIIAESI